MAFGQELMWFNEKPQSEKVDLIFRGWELPEAALIPQLSGFTAQAAYIAMLELVNGQKWLALCNVEKKEPPASLLSRTESLQMLLKEAQLAIDSVEVAMTVPFALHTPVKIRQSLLQQKQGTLKAQSTNEYHAAPNLSLAARPLAFDRRDLMSTGQPLPFARAPSSPLRGLSARSLSISPMASGAAADEVALWDSVLAAQASPQDSFASLPGDVMITGVEKAPASHVVNLASDAPSSERDQLQQLCESVRRLDQRAATYQDISHLFSTEPKGSVDWWVPLTPTRN